jgi:hypothetical protein
MGHLNTAKGRCERHPGFTVFSVVFVVCLVIGAIQGTKVFFGDSGGYWYLSETFTAHGSFSLFSFEYTGLRGYGMPLALFLLRKVGDLFDLSAQAEVVLLNSTIFALLAGFLVPALARIGWPQRPWGVLPRLAMGALFLIFWSGYLNYPLTDFPALAAAVLAIVAISRSRSPGWLCVAGLSAAYAVDLRPAYLLLIPLLALVLAWTWWRDRAEAPTTTVSRIVCVGAFVLGLAIVSLPQSAISHHYGRGLSPLPGGSSLAGLQYTEGLRLQRYETYVGEEGKPFMDYIDPHTKSILAELPLETVSGTSKYLEIFIEHPITLGGVFLRHIVNGLDQRYTTPYVEHLEGPARKIIRLIGFLLVFLALFRLFWPRGRRSLGQMRARYPLALLLCCLTSIPSAIETRFMLPVFLLSGVIVLTPGWPSPIEREAIGAARLRTVGVGCLALGLYLFVVGSIVNGATSNLRIL